MVSSSILGVVALQHGKAIGTDIDLFADGLQIQILCSNLIVDNGEVLKAGSIVAVDDSGVNFMMSSATLTRLPMMVT